MSAPLPSSMPAVRCLFCPPAAISPRQLLMSSPHFYLLAPVGQLVEGYLQIVTHECRDQPVRLRCIADVPHPWLSEVLWMQSVIRAFYDDVYGAPAFFYEHGRGGGAATGFADEDYSYHPHLCALPGAWRIRHVLEREFTGADASLEAASKVASMRPYVYVEYDHGPSRIYVSAPGGEDVQRLRIKRVLAEENQLDNGWDWRSAPGHEELDRLIDTFNTWYRSNYENYGAHLLIDSGTHAY